MGVAKGNSEMPVANELFGSRMTFSHTNIGIQINSITGQVMDWVSRMSVQDAPIAINSEPNISTASI